MSNVFRYGWIGVLVFLVFLITFVTMHDAKAQGGGSSCGARADIVAHLAKKFNEHRNNMMLDQGGNLVEIFSNLKTLSWTMVVTQPEGSSCVIQSGESFVSEERNPAMENKGQKS